MKFADLKKSAEKKYSPLDVTLEDDSVVLLRIPIRLSKEERKAISAAFDIDKDAEDKDIMDIYEAVFRIVIEDEERADALIEALDEDLSVYTELFNAFAEKMQLGEANGSKN